MNFQKLLEKLNAERQQTSPETLLAIDPGETTGYAIYKNGKIICEEIQVGLHNLKQIWDLIDSCKLDVVVCEDYIIYGSKAKMHAWNKLVTPQIIGAIRLSCELLKVPLYMQMASTAKGFCNDTKLKEWGFWIKGHDHSRDAIRHVIYFLLFHNERKMKNEFYSRK